MYEYIKGIVAATGTDYIVIENNGIGFKIFTSVNTMAKIEKNDSNVMMHTYLHVREDIMVLYGFADKEELSLFNMLIGISGIGPKAGLSILSTFTPRAVAVAIAGNNPKELSKAKGIGKKTAERIILELKDKFKALQKDLLPGETTASEMDTVAEEAKTALMVLGYSPNEARKAVDVSLGENLTLEELIRGCLKYLNG
ncbi:MAG: Holliday junction branch migration protein RuvA [Clostridiales bacterium]|nr:Holliday junction branch migration protein RuvA [Clostridiales bacterium]